MVTNDIINPRPIILTTLLILSFTFSITTCARVRSRTALCPQLSAIIALFPLPIRVAVARAKKKKVSPLRQVSVCKIKTLTQTDLNEDYNNYKTIKEIPAIIPLPFLQAKAD